MCHVCAKLKVTYAYQRGSAPLIIQKYFISTGSIKKKKQKHKQTKTTPPQNPSTLRNNTW